MIQSSLSRFHRLLLILALGVVASSPALGSATITIQNNDGPGVGFNDPTPATPVGGNSGTTVGQQRLIAFNFAANIWGTQLNSNVPIVIRAGWVPQSCDATMGTLGSAGTINVHRNFTGAPFSNTWYGTALANSLAGSDLNGATPEIDASFNVNAGTPGCLPNSPWYYGLDGQEGNGNDLVAVLLHEFAHGFGVQTFTNKSTGAFFNGSPMIYDRFLRDNTTGKVWTQMTDGERAGSAVNTGNLVWDGPQVTTFVPNVLATPRLRVNLPAGIAGNYVVGTAQFGGKLSTPGITNKVVAASPANGCSAITPSGVHGKIAFIDRGSCDFVVKVKNAQNAGALAVIIGNVGSSASPDVPPGMGGSDPTINIATVSLALNDANIIRGQLANNINATVSLDRTVFSGADSSNRAKMYAPSTVVGGSSVSHYDESLFPNQLMEPNSSDDLTHSVNVPEDLTLVLLRDLGWSTAPPPPSIQFSSSSFGTSESAGSMEVTVTRTGDTSSPSTVEYATSDTSGLGECNVSTGAASSRCDYVQTIGKLTFAAGQTTKVILVPIVNDVFVDGPTETFTIALSNATNGLLGTSTSTATLSISDNDTSLGTNPIDDPEFFVRQHYIDFLNREPDAAGLNFWKNEITSCGSNAQCIEVKRINVSAAFFLSIEFQQTGYFVERVYKTAFGTAIGNSTLGASHILEVPFVNLNQFLADKQQIGDGVVVGAPGWEALLNSRKDLYVADFVQRSNFTKELPASLTPADFVSILDFNAGNPLSPSERDQLVAELTNGTKTRAQVLRAVAEDSDLESAEFRRAFVLAQYFGYMRRNPNDLPDSDYTGYDFWLTKLNDFNGDFLNAEMVKAFILSGEYRHRFGP